MDDELRKAAGTAVDVWDDTGTRHEDVVNAMNDLRKVLAKNANAAPEQEPVGEVVEYIFGKHEGIRFSVFPAGYSLPIGTKLYTHPMPAPAAPEQEPVANRPSEAERRSLVTECGLEWDEGSETSSNDPFAWATFDGEGSYDLRLYECNEDYRAEYIKRNGDKYSGWVIPLYTAPAPQREWVGLTDEQENQFVKQLIDCGVGLVVPLYKIIEKIDTALKEKNHG